MNKSIALIIVAFVLGGLITYVFVNNKHVENQSAVAILGTTTDRTPVSKIGSPASIVFRHIGICPPPNICDLGVQNAQKVLTVTGFYGGDIDGTINKDMVVALTSFQKANGLPTTGTLDDQTKTLVDKMQIPINQNPVGIIFKNVTVCPPPVNCDLAIQNTQKALTVMGFYNGTDIDGLMSQSTIDAVKQFQKVNSLSVTGMLDDKTQALINQKAQNPVGIIFKNVTVCPPPANCDLAIQNTQKALTVMGFYNGTDIDGTMNQNTMDAVKQFQKTRGLSQTGALDDQTKNLINQASVSSNQNPVAIMFRHISICPPPNICDANVQNAQKVLSIVNLYGGDIDGLMNKDTTTALTSFQRTNGLPATGTLDARTESFIEAKQNAASFWGW